MNWIPIINLMYSFFFIILLSTLNGFEAYEVGPTATLYNQINYAGSSVSMVIGADPTFIQSDWKQFPGGLTGLSYDGNQICGVDINSSIWCGIIDFGGGDISWRLVPGGLNQVYVYGSKLVGVFQRSIWVGSSTGNPGWTLVAGALDSVAYDGTNMCGLILGGVWCANSAYPAAWDWKLLPTPTTFKSFSIGAGKIYAVSTNNTIYYKTSMNNTIPWSIINGGLDTISFDGGQLLCGTLGTDIYCATLNLDTYPNWKRLNGALNQIVAWAPKIFGLVGSGTGNKPIYGDYLWLNPCTNVSPSGFDTHSFTTTNNVCVFLFNGQDCSGNITSVDSTATTIRSNLQSNPATYPALSFHQCTFLFGTYPAV